MKREIVDSVKMLLGNEDRINDNTALLHWACNSLSEHDSNASVLKEGIKWKINEWRKKKTCGSKVFEFI